MALCAGGILLAVLILFIPADYLGLGLPLQHIVYSKSSWIHADADLPVSQEKLHLSYGLLRWLHERRHRD